MHEKAMKIIATESPGLARSVSFSSPAQATCTQRWQYSVGKRVKKGVEKKIRLAAAATYENELEPINFGLHPYMYYRQWGNVRNDESVETASTLYTWGT